MDQETLGKLRPFLRRVERHFKPVRCILFGSRARGETLQDSDYDLLLISPAFEGIAFYERHVQVYGLQREALDIDVICLTPKEFLKRKKELSVIGEAAREGVDIAA